MTSPPLLTFPQRDATFILDTDASFTSIGAVLSQKQNGQEVVIEYGSRKMSNTELKYCITRKELLSIVQFTTHFKHYLLGQKFLIRTDHKALEWMLNVKKPSTTQYSRWIEDLQQFDFDIIHRKGYLHTNADVLSRLDQCQQCDIKHLDPKLKRNVRDITNDYNLLNTISEVNTQIVDTHRKLGHVGIARTYEFLNDGQHRFSMESIKRVINSCLQCQQKKQTPTGRKQSDLSFFAAYPFQKIMMDITGPLKTSRYGYTHILGIIDVFSRYPLLVPLRNTSTDTVYRVLYDKWISVYGIPEEVITDNAANFSAKEFVDKLKSMQIVKVPTCSHFSQGKGIVERLFRTMKERMFCSVQDDLEDWVDVLPRVLLGLRTTTNVSVGTSPYSIIFGKKYWEKQIGNTLMYQEKVCEKMKILE